MSTPLRIEIRTGKMRTPPKEWITNHLKDRLRALRILLIESGLADDGQLILSCEKKVEFKLGDNVGQINLISYKGGFLYFRYQSSDNTTAVFFYNCLCSQPGSTGQMLMDIFSRALAKEKELISNGIIPTYLREGFVELPKKDEVGVSQTPISEQIVSESPSIPKPQDFSKEVKQTETLKSIPQITDKKDDKRDSLRGFINEEVSVSIFLERLFGNTVGFVISELTIKSELANMTKNSDGRAPAQVLRALVSRGKIKGVQGGYILVGVNQAGLASEVKKLEAEQIIPVVIPVVEQEKPLDTPVTAEVKGHEVKTNSFIDGVRALVTLNDSFVRATTTMLSCCQAISEHENSILALEKELEQRKLSLESLRAKKVEFEILVDPKGEAFKAHQELATLKEIIGK
ncbi:MAG: hypothetical protein WC827_02285 [Candidatus Paceibacterota bacterium]|jgi:hypothetical protein